MLITLMAPEVLVGMALVDWISARTSNEEMESFALQDGWSGVWHMDSTQIWEGL